MKKYLLLAFAVLCVACTAAPSTTTCVNPITYADTPDPDIVRVGDDYYMVTTTMYYHPMVPIMHSKDLVHWQIVSYVCDDLGEGDWYTFTDGKNAYGKGQWATSLQYHDGYFYALFITNEQQRTFIYRTKDACSSGWERVCVLDRFFHDASLLFDDDGRVYVVYGNRQLFITELEADLSGIKEDGLDMLLIDFNPEGFMLCAEGSRFYHIGDWYYLMEIDWPAGGVRTERVWRSRELTGPYESRVMCSGTLGGLTAGIAQGPLVQTQFGDWYALLFQDHGAVGRICTVQPVTWVDQWPVAGNDTAPVETLEVNLPPCGDNWIWDNDEFDSADLKLVWQWNHKPMNDCWSLKERPGWMRLTTGQIATGLADARNTLTQRTVGPACTSEVKLDVSGLQEGDYAGITAFASFRCAIGVAVENGIRKLLVIDENRRDGRTVIFEQPYEADEILLRINYLFGPDTATVAWSSDGEKWNDVDYTLQMRFSLDYFTGYRTGLFCYSTLHTGGHADFDWFHQRIAESPGIAGQEETANE